MKKTIAILLCVICIGAHSAKQDLSNERSKMKETSKIEDEYSSGTLGKSQFIKKLTVCSNNGNILCTLRLTDIYLTEKNDSKALPLLQKQAVYNSQSNDDISSMIRTNANYALGESYMFGTGVLQDFDKALKYFE
ncbi:MAG: hypothetical protein NTZ86_09745 [Legionellales bacterium]|nr:hypothetical protein [Legionellales bacterium]